MQKIYRQNEIKWYLQTMLTSTAMLAGSGTIIQGFLLHYAVSAENVGIYSTFAQGAQALIMFSAAAFIDRVRSIKRLFSLSTLVQSLFFILMLFFVHPDAGANAFFFPVMMCLSVFYNLALGIRAIITYKIPYLIIDMKEYGRVSVMECIVLAVFSVFFSSLASKLLTDMPFESAMRLLFNLAAFMVVLSAFIITRFRLQPAKEEEKPSKGFDASLFTDRRFYLYILPNLLRGIASGILSMAAVFAAKELLADDVFISRLVIAAQAASLISFTIYLILIKNISSRMMTMIGSLLFCLSPLLGLIGNETGYLAVYFIVFVGVNFFSVGIPVVVADHIPYRIIGGYTAFRMLLTTGGTALGSLISGYAIQSASSLTLYVIASAMQLFTGVCYLFFHKIKNAPRVRKDVL